MKMRANYTDIVIEMGVSKSLKRGRIGIIPLRDLYMTSFSHVFAVSDTRP